MDSRGRPNPSGNYGPATDILATVPSSSTTQNRSYHRQGRSGSDTTPSSHQAIPPPSVAPSRPALWQLGRHSQYITNIWYYQQPPRPSVQPVLGSAEGYGDGNQEPERVQHHLMNTHEAGLRDVEEELHRALQARQISMITLGPTIGAGLVIGTGSALRRGGPLGILLGYSFIGLICFCLMQSIGEMATYLPHKKGFAGYTARFWHPALGFALGWSYVLWAAVCAPNLIGATGVVVLWWDKDGKFPSAVWMGILVFFILCANFLGIGAYGELEFWLMSIKVLTLIGLIMFGIITLAAILKEIELASVIGASQGQLMGKYLEETVGNGPLATFLGLWSAMMSAFGAYTGIELIGVTVGEAENPSRNVPKAIRRTFIGITALYIIGVFVIGLIVPSDAPAFVGGEAAKGVAASPFVLAAEMLHIRGLVHVINASLLIFIVSAANSCLYIASRTLYGLALLNQAPKILRKVTKRGVPVWALLFSWLFSFLLLFLNLGESPRGVVTYLFSVMVTFSGITWMCILYTHIRFMRGLAMQGHSRDSLPYKAAFQPLASWFALVSIGVIMIFQGLDAFIHRKDEKFKAADFVAAYIGIPIFFLFAAFWKWKENDHTVLYATMDLITGKQNIDDEEKAYLEAQELLGPRPRWKRILDAL